MAAPRDALHHRPIVSQGGPIRVFLCDDVEAFRALMRFTLAEDPEIEVVGEAGDGETAVSLTQQTKPDLVILDVKMPVMDGITAAEQIARDRIAPVVMLTAFSQRDLVERAREAGAMAYLVKPFSKSDLLPAIEIALSRYAQIAALESEVSDLQERLATRKIIDRAKGVLQTEHGMTEPAAFRWIQKVSMDGRRSMREVAQGVVDGTFVPGA
jgi:response regulator NasT